MRTATRIGRVLTYLEGLLPQNLHGCLVKWSCEIIWQIKTIIFPLSQCLGPKAWQIKNIISSLPQCLWPTNLSRWWHTMTKSRVLQSRVFVRSHGILGMLYFHSQKTYEHQTRQGGDLPWQAPTLKVTWHFDHVSNMWSHKNLPGY